MANFYHLFKTTSPDGCAYFGIHGNESPDWGSIYAPIDYIGRGQKLLVKIAQYGLKNMKTEVLLTSSNLNELKNRIEQILTPATYADPLCLNISNEEMARAVAAARLGTLHHPDTKTSISISMQDNQNALGHVKSDEVKANISNQKQAAGYKWTHNPETREEIMLEKDEEILTGFVKGRLPFSLKKKKAIKKGTETAEALVKRLA